MPYSCHALAAGLAEGDREDREHGGAHLGARLPPDFRVVSAVRPREVWKVVDCRRNSVMRAVIAREICACLLVQSTLGVA